MLVSENLPFFVYSGMATIVAIFALAYGSPSKVLGAAIVLGGIINANVWYVVARNAVISGVDLLLIICIVDVLSFRVFDYIALHSGAAYKQRWALALAALYLAMLALTFAALLNHEIRHSGAYLSLLNVLTAAALVVCLIGFTPRSWGEAKGVLMVKLLYIKYDLLRLRRDAGTALRMAGIDESKGGTTIDAKIGRRIWDARIVADLTREQVAHALGVSPQQIEKYEKGINRISAGVLFSLSKVLRQPISFFYENVEPAGDFIPSLVKGRAHGKSST